MCCVWYYSQRDTQHEKGGVVMDATDALRQQLNVLHTILDQQYPERINELANLLNQTHEQVQYALEYTCDEMHENKHALINKLLMFHRVIDRGSELK